MLCNKLLVSTTLNNAIPCSKFIMASELRTVEQPVSNHKDGTAYHQGIHALLDKCLSTRINTELIPR